MTTPELPPTAYPAVVYADDIRVTPDRIGVHETEHAIDLVIAGARLSTSKHADDARLSAAMETSYQISRDAARHADLLRAEVDRRERQRKADMAAAAERAAQGTHPYANGHAEPVVDAEHARSLLGPAEPVDDTCRTLTLPTVEAADVAP